MSTNFKPAGSVRITTFWGGVARGKCVQLTGGWQNNKLGHYEGSGYFQITMAEAEELASALTRLVKGQWPEEFEDEPESQAEASPKVGPCTPWWSPDDKMMAEMGYDTIAGWLGKRGLIEGTPGDLLSEDQRRHAFACVHETARKGYEVIKVVAPNCLRMISLPDGGWINTVNAYPVEIIERRMLEKGIV